MQYTFLYLSSLCLKINVYNILQQLKNIQKQQVPNPGNLTLQITNN